MFLLTYRGSRIKSSHNPRLFIPMVLLAVFPNFPLDGYTMTGGDKVMQRY